eukprot:g5792.t1
MGRVRRNFQNFVRSHVKHATQAKFVAYPRTTVIHAVGPNLRSNPDEPVARLATTYKNIFQEARTAAEWKADGHKHKLTHLRLLPVSSGAFSGGFSDQMPRMTAQAIARAWSSLDPHDRVFIHNHFGGHVTLCIFEGESAASTYRSNLLQQSQILDVDENAQKQKEHSFLERGQMGMETQEARRGTALMGGEDEEQEEGNKNIL